MGVIGTVYLGWRDKQGCMVKTVREGRAAALRMRLALRSHSPTGFEWGYGGSGPAQLALALACDVLASTEDAQDVYQELKSRWVVHLPYHCWSASEYDLRAVVRPLLLSLRPDGQWGGWMRELVSWADDPRASEPMKAP